MHSTFSIERSFAASRERVFEALSDPAKKRTWQVEAHGNQVDSYDLDFKSGGWERARFRFREGSPVAGMVCANDGVFLDIVPNERVVQASTMSIGGRVISVSLITYELVATDKGTDLIFTHQGVFYEGSGGPEMREHGWRVLLDGMARVV